MNTITCWYPAWSQPISHMQGSNNNWIMAMTWIHDQRCTMVDCWMNCWNKTITNTPLTNERAGSTWARLMLSKSFEIKTVLYLRYWIRWFTMHRYHHPLLLFKYFHKSRDLWFSWKYLIVWSLDCEYRNAWSGHRFSWWDEQCRAGGEQLTFFVVCWHNLKIWC